MKRAWLPVVLVCTVLAGCSNTLVPDFDRARRLMQRERAPEVPAVEESPTAEIPTPETLRAISGELRSVPLRWEPLLVGDVGGYVVERAFAREGPFARIAVVPGRLTTVYLDAKAVPDVPEGDGPGEPQDGITCFYRVRAFAPDGRLAVDPSEIAAATTAPAPDPPENLRAYSHQPRQAPLSWSASDDPLVVGYLLERSPSATGPFESLAELSGRYETGYVDRGLGDLRVFYYRISARNAAGGVGKASEVVRAVTKPEPLPPIGLRVEAQALGANQLSWEPNVERDIDRYRLLRIRNGADSAEVVTTVGIDRTTAWDPAVGAGETVEYRVVVFDRDGLESDASKPVSVTSEAYGLTATARPDGVHIEWRDRREEGFTGARVFRTTGLAQRELPFVTGTRTVDPDVKPGRSYRYNVVLERPDGTQAPRSTAVEIRIPER